jgi:hypothetical protein
LESLRKKELKEGKEENTRNRQTKEKRGEGNEEGIKVQKIRK